MREPVVSSVLKGRSSRISEIARPGTYFLTGTDEDAQDRQLAHIGKSEEVGARLSYHNSNEAGRDATGF